MELDLLLSLVFLIWVISLFIDDYDGQIIRPATALLNAILEWWDIFTSPPPPSDVKARDSGNRVPKEIWMKLLAPLDLIDCIRLESTCQHFRRSIYWGQKRFVWNKHFQDRLSNDYYINSTRANEERFLLIISKKIGPYCRHLTLKIQRMLPNFQKFFYPFVCLESLYLKIRFYTPAFDLFILNPSVLPITTFTAFRLTMIKAKKNWLPAGFPKFIAYFPKMKALAMWKGEAQFIEHLLVHDELQVFSLFCDDAALTKPKDKEGAPFLVEFATKFGPTLKGFYIRWQTQELQNEHLITFSQAFKKMLTLTHLELQFNWTTFAKMEEGSSPKGKNVHTIWYAFINSNKWTRYLKKLSIDCQHNNFASIINCNTLVSTLTRKIENLQVLRVVVSEPDVFPLNIEVKSVDTFEVNFHYVKRYLEIWQYMDPRRVMPKHTDGLNYIFGKFKSCKTVRSLRLINIPLLDKTVLTHIARFFTNLETLYIKAFSKSVYNKDTFPSDMSAFVDLLPRLRVIKLADSFEKPLMEEVLYKMAQRAIKYPRQAYIAYIDTAKKLSTFRFNLKKIHNFRAH